MAGRLLLSMALFGLTMARADNSFNYHVTRAIPLPGQGGWDYLSFDAVESRIFVSHGNLVQVVDANQGAVVGQIDDTPGVHGIALAQDLGRGYISAGRASTVVVFDLKTLARLGEIKTTGENPDAIVYEPKTHRILTFNGRGRNATVIDAKSNGVLGTIPLDAKPEFAQADGTGVVYVNLEDKNSLAVVDAASMSVKKTWPMAGCHEPSGLALDNPHHRLFAVCANKVMAVLDATSGKVLDTLPIGGFADGVVFDSKTELAFASCGEGVMTVVHEDSPLQFKVVQTVTTQAGARTVTLDERLHRVYTSAESQPILLGEDQSQPSRANTFTLLMLEP